jgi:hypothetical protein
MSDESSIEFWKKKLAESEQLRLLQGIEITEMWQYILELLDRTDKVERDLTEIASCLEYEDEDEDGEESFM